MKNEKLIKLLTKEYDVFIDKLKEINFYKSMIYNANKIILTTLDK